MISALISKNKQLITYAFFGGFGVLSDVSLYSALVLLNVNYQIANTAGYFTGTMISFFLNRSYTFKVKDKIFIRMFKFFSVAFVGYISSVALLYILIDVMHMNEIAAKFLTLFFVLLIQYTLNKKITFKE
jgi:putative flippase GtrA